MRLPRSRGALVLGTVAVVGLYLFVQLVVSASFSSPQRSREAAAALPLLLKLHKTGGTSLASALARAVLCGDGLYGAWRARLDGRGWGEW